MSKSISDKSSDKGSDKGSGSDKGRARRKSSRKVRRKSPLNQIVRKHIESRAPVKASPSPSNGTRNHWEPGELRAFFKQLPPSSIWYAYFYIEYFYGCRLSEPALVLDEDVTFKQKKIVIRRLKKAQEAEGYMEQSYPADARVLDCVKTALLWKEQKHVTANPFLFASNRRRAPDSVGAERLSQLRSQPSLAVGDDLGWQAVSRFTAHRMFNRLAAAAKIPAALRHSHVLRHTRAVMMLALGATTEQVQGLLGHSSLKMTQRYASVAEELKKKMSTSVVSEIEAMGLGL